LIFIPLLPRQDQRMGFIETHTGLLKNGKVNSTERCCYLSAEEEDGKIIAHPNSLTNEKGEFLSKEIKARFEGDFPLVAPEKLNFSWMLRLTRLFPLLLH